MISEWQRTSDALVKARGNCADVEREFLEIARLPGVSAEALAVYAGGYRKACEEERILLDAFLEMEP